MNNADRTPYTYLIGWSKLEKYYYGVRFAKNCSPDDLWKTYFTSSKHVKQFREINGEPDIIQVRRIFTNKDSARAWESKLLMRIDVLNNSKFINKTNNVSINTEFSSIGGKSLKSYECREKIKLANIGKKLSDKTKKKISKANFGKKRNSTYNYSVSEELKQKLSEIQKSKTGSKSPFYGKRHSAETINKIKQSIALRRLQTVSL